MKFTALLGAALLAAACLAQAQAPAGDAAFEQRVNAIAMELRCLVCQNQTIADSNAGLAVDLKNQIREQLRAGRSEQEILAFMSERYGDFVLYRPPLKASTVLLWAGPFLILAAGLFAAVRVVRRHRAGAEVRELTEAQRLQAARLLDEPGPPR
jgi:cytochrome c-type biogenesis protein CcmH